eukprot:c9131_g1_i2.p1 GENE.c9131_g1_i2~~c9131_g1_i2.p1  ORF type:complete len:400 (-),score=85.92 c9131_g1_i2:44-1243(-)
MWTLSISFRWYCFRARAQWRTGCRSSRDSSDSDFSMSPRPSCKIKRKRQHPLTMQVNLDGDAEDSDSSPYSPPVTVQHLQTLETKLSAVEFELLGTIGKGSFGRVLLAERRTTGEVFALKVLNKSFFLQRSLVPNAIRENHMMKEMNHPFVIRHCGSFQNEQHLFIVMERVIGANLYDILQEVGKLTEKFVQFIVAEVVLAIEYMHSRNIVYRDLKPENILIDNTGHVKVIDMGFATKLNVSTKTFTFCGSPCFLAPEQIARTGHGFGVDWWALGVMMYELIKGSPPVDNENLPELLNDIVNSEPTFDESFSTEAADLISRLLTKNPEHRLGCGPDKANEIKRHEFFKNINWESLNQRHVTSPFEGAECIQCGLEPFADDEWEDVTTPAPDEQRLFESF